MYAVFFETHGIDALSRVAISLSGLVFVCSFIQAIRMAIGMNACESFLEMSDDTLEISDLDEKALSIDLDDIDTIGLKAPQMRLLLKVLDKQLCARLRAYIISAIGSGVAVVAIAIKIQHLF